MLELFVTFFKLGMFTIGGGIAMIPILQNIMVNDKRWFSEDDMIDIIAVSQSMPGIIAVNMATYVGFKRRGFLGSLVSTAGIVLPSFVIILLIARGLAVLSDNHYILGALGGLKAAAVGMIILALWQVGRSVMKDAFSVVGAIASFILIAFFHVNIIYIILLFIAIGVYRAMRTASKIDGGDPR